MFKRWVILLLVLMALSAGASYHYRQEFNETFSYSSVTEECMRYLRSADDNWTSVGDTYWQSRCEDGNYYSDYMEERRWRDQAAKLAAYAAITGFGIFVVLFLSFIGRWLVTGRLKWD